MLPRIIRKKKLASFPPRTVVHLLTFTIFTLAIFAATYGFVHLARVSSTILNQKQTTTISFSRLQYSEVAATEVAPLADDIEPLADDIDTDDAPAFSLFGGISGLNIYMGTVSVIIIVFAVQLVEYSFHLLQAITHDTPFHRMVQSIEKELMVVGFTAFMFKVLVNTTSFLNLGWFQALDYADMVVNLFSFSYCGLGLMLVLNSVRISNMWSQAYHLTLIEMLNDYFNLNGFVGFLPYGLLVAPFNPTIARMEFRIFQSIFCQTYKIQKSAFAFNEYVEKVFEKFILLIVKIRRTDWLLVCVLVLLNWARNKLQLDYRQCAARDQLCEDENARVMFSIAGAVIFGFTTLLAVESRRLEVRIMAQKNIRSIHMYPSYLRYMEESAEAKSMDAFRLNKDELKNLAEGVKFSRMRAEDSESDSDDGDDEGRAPATMLSRMRSVFVRPSGGRAQGSRSVITNSNIKSKPKDATKFSASVKQAWKTKKIVSKMRRKSLMHTQPPKSRLAVRRTGVLGLGLGLPGFVFGGAQEGGGGGGSGSMGGGSWTSGKGEGGGANTGSEQDLVDSSVRSRQSLMPRAPQKWVKIAAIAEDDDNNDDMGNGSSRSRSSSSSSSSDSVPSKTEAREEDSARETALARGDGTREEAISAVGASQAAKSDTTCRVDLEFVSKESTEPVVLSARGRPSVSTQRWKAAPLEPIESHGFFHVFSKAQRAVDANKQTRASVHPARAPAESFSPSPSPAVAARYVEAYREDSKLSWADSPARTTKQLPPLSQRGPIANYHIDQNNATTPSGVCPSGGATETRKTASGDIELGGSVRSKLPPIQAKSKPATTQASPGAVPARTNTVCTPDVPSFAAIANATGAARVILSPSRTREKSLPPSHHASSSSEFSHIENGQDGQNRPQQTLSQQHQPYCRSGDTESITQTKYAPVPTHVNSPVQGVSNQREEDSCHPDIYRQNRTSNASMGNAEEEEESVPIVDVFFLSWPELYIEAVQSLIMILSLYYSLLFTNFLAAARTPGWCFVMLIPAVLSSLLLVYIIKCAVMLSAIHAVDCDAILEVLEQTEGARALSALMREKVMALLNEMGDDPEVELYNLFAEVDSDHSGAISRDEFAEYMNSIEIHFDRHRWMQVFRGIDTTFDNKITFEEFFVFMFPSTSHGKELQQKKERALQESLTRRSEQRLAELSHYSRSSSHYSYTPPAANKHAPACGPR